MSSPPGTSSARFVGLGNDDNSACTQVFEIEPPDPQVAVGPNHVLETVNILGRIYTRGGTTQYTFRLRDFFGLPSGYSESDPKILYDTLSGRWFATYLSSVNATSGPDEGRLHIAVSATSDPLVWNTYYIPYVDRFPDFPGIGLTSDKVTVSSNLFDINTVTFVGEHTIVLQKADLLGGVGSSPFAFPIRTDRQTTRPAHSLTAVSDQYLVSRRKIPGEFCHESLDSTLTLIRITGTPAAGNVTEASATDLTVIAQTDPRPGRRAVVSAISPTHWAGSALRKKGEFRYSANTGLRWGDYMGAAVDPVIPDCVWLVSQYSKDFALEVKNWGTYIAASSYGGDSDCDTWSDAAEGTIGTNPLSHCGTNAWPADIDNDGISDIVEIDALSSNFALHVPPAPARHDISPDPPDRVVDIGDIDRLVAFFAQSCS